MTNPRGSRLPLYEQVYRELDATYIGAERQRNVPGKKRERYDCEHDMGIDDDYITVRSDNRTGLDFAEKVAQYYGAEYFIKEELWRSSPKDRYKIYIKVCNDGEDIYPNKVKKEN